MAAEASPPSNPEQSPQSSRTNEAAQEAHRNFNTVVGEAIRKARQAHSWTQAVLAEQAGLSPNYIARLERGELGPSLFVANQICEALGIALETLVAGANFAPRTGVKRKVLSSTG